jgi:hypothetical protein
MSKLNNYVAPNLDAPGLQVAGRSSVVTDREVLPLQSTPPRRLRLRPSDDTC